MHFDTLHLFLYFQTLSSVKVCKSWNMYSFRLITNVVILFQLKKIHRHSNNFLIFSHAHLKSKAYVGEKRGKIKKEPISVEVLVYSQWHKNIFVNWAWRHSEFFVKQIAVCVRVCVQMIWPVTVHKRNHTTQIVYQCCCFSFLPMHAVIVVHGRLLSLST